MILDLQTVAHPVKIIILQILEDRCENASTLICSQLPIPDWFPYLDEPTLADAILDRLLTKAHCIELKGKSLRQRSNTYLNLEKSRMLCKGRSNLSSKGVNPSGIRNNDS
jgi:DNA replication protein DnaC